MTLSGTYRQTKLRVTFYEIPSLKAQDGLADKKEIMTSSRRSSLVTREGPSSCQQRREWGPRCGARVACSALNTLAYQGMIQRHGPRSWIWRIVNPTSKSDWRIANPTSKSDGPSELGWKMKILTCCTVLLLVPRMQMWDPLPWHFVIVDWRTTKRVGK